MKKSRKLICRDFLGTTAAAAASPLFSDRWWGGESPGTFLKAAPVNQTILLGGVALRAGKNVDYDPEKVEIPNAPEANEFLTRTYKKGWEL
jgi:hypothetical protein